MADGINESRNWIVYLADGSHAVHVSEHPKSHHVSQIKFSDMGMPGLSVDGIFYPEADLRWPNPIELVWYRAGENS